MSNIPARASRTVQRRMTDEDDDMPDDYYPQRMPTSVRRYTPREEVYTQGNRRIVVHHDPPPKKQSHWLVWVGFAMMIMLLGWMLLNIIGTWWTNLQNTWTYGYPRTYQTSAVVGHHDSPDSPTHFLALNLNGHTEVIEIPGGDMTHEKVYVGPTIYSSNPDLVPVTLSFKDVNGDGKPDMLIHVQDQTIVFLNNGSQFLAPKQ